MRMFSLSPSAPQLFAVLGAELVGTVGAAQRRVGYLPEALGVHHHAQLPHQPHRDRQQDQAQGVEAAHADHGREHHQMVPVEDAAGRAAAVLHNEPEGAPDQYADQVADIERERDEEERRVGEDAQPMQQRERNHHRRPEQEDPVGGAGGVDDVLAQRLIVDLAGGGAEAETEEAETEGD